MRPQLNASRFFKRVLSLVFLSILGITFLPQQGLASDTDIVINEILYEVALGEAYSPYIELHNQAAAVQDLSGWQITGAVSYRFPVGTTIQPGGYLVIASVPGLLKTAADIDALGPYEGHLPQDEEGYVALLNADNQRIDELTYGVSFPWPTSNDQTSQAIELLTPWLDNGQAGHWRAGGPTPGRANSVSPTGRTAAFNLPPYIEAVSHNPQTPRSGQDVTITAEVTDLDGVQWVEMSYQIVAPGNYIRIFDEAYETQWTTLIMNDGGTGADARAKDDLYTVVIPAELQGNRYLVRYRITARDNQGAVITTPYEDDDQPNFAYFVYDGVPTWRGAVKPGSSDYKGEVLEYKFQEMEDIPVYHVIARAEDIQDAQFIPDSPLEEGYMGHDWLWYGTLVYNGEVLDHIRFRARGGAHRYDMGKNMWKFNFWSGHRLQAHDDYGKAYSKKWDKLNLSAIIQQSEAGRRMHRGEQGLLESVTYRMFNLAGVEAPHTHYVHLRVIDNPIEANALNQYDGDFWGLYLAVEQPDGRFLDAHDLPNGNLYKMEDGTGELNNHGEGMPEDLSDLNAFLDAYTNTWPTDAWWAETLNLPQYYTYRSVLEAAHHYNVETLKNYYYFNNPETGKWSVHPWDVDQTWGDTMAGDGNEPFRDRVLVRPDFYRAYQNQMREVRDLLYNEEQIYMLIDETAAFVDQPGRSIVEADRAMWDYNPILTSRYISPIKTQPGDFYQLSPTGDFAGMAEVMKAYLRDRTEWIDEEILDSDDGVSATPSLAYTGRAGYPINALSFHAGDFVDPWGHNFAGMEWRIGEVYNPTVPNYESHTRYIYEIEPVWRSDVISTHTSEIQIPPTVLRANRTYRARVRMLNSSGRWSHWSAPIEFTTAEAVYSPVAGQLIVTELMYNPIKSGDYEFIELKNTRRTPIFMSRVTFVEGIDYVFPSDFKIDPGAFAVIAKNPALFEAEYGFPPSNTEGYEGQLDNSGEQIVLVDNQGLIITDFTYDDVPPWPTEPDGSGFSLARRMPPEPPAVFCSWQRSTNLNGSAGEDDPLNAFYTPCARSYLPFVAGGS